MPSNSRTARRAPLFDHPLAPALIGLAFAAIVVTSQLARDGGDVSTFVRASPPWTDPAAVPAGLRVLDRGYDGMFYYRLALDPFTDRMTDRGITFDTPAYRQQRILYPLLAWIGSGGEEQRVPLALVLVNVAGMFAMGWLGGSLARDAGRHALWGSVFPLYPGTVVTLTNDLTEIVAAALLLAALRLLRSERTTGAAVVLALAVLARETTALVAAAAAVTRWLRSPRDPRRWVALALPGLILVGWQVALTLRWQRGLPADEGVAALWPPLAGILGAGWLNGERLHGADALVWVAVIAFVLAMIVVGARALARPARAHERAAWYGYLALAVVLQPNIWANSGIVRTLTELGMLTALLTMGATARLRSALLAIEVGLCIVYLVTGGQR